MSHFITLQRNSYSAVSALLDTITTNLTAVKELSQNTYHAILSGRSGSGATENQSLTNFKRQFKKNKFFYLPLLVILILIIGGIFLLTNRANSVTPRIAGANDERIELKPALDTQDINKTFSFPLKDGAGKEVSKIQYTIEKAELRDEIIVKGQRATSVKGRTFLILPIKITNSYNALVEINARDYVRLVVNNSNEKLAPDIHNDPVEVQAISTKVTRLGFPINDTDKKLVLQVGEINGEKQNITLTLEK